jgi:hypothetical protein
MNLMTSEAALRLLPAVEQAKPANDVLFFAEPRNDVAE